MSVRTIAVVLIGLALPGCDLQFTDPYTNLPADFVSDLRIVDGQPEALQFSGRIRPGRDRRGDVRAMEDEALTILGVWMQPEPGPSSELRTYHHEWTRAKGGPPTLPTLLAPRLEGVHQVREELAFGLCHRSEQEERVISPSDTLRFAVACDPTPDGLRHTGWQLEVRQALGNGLVMSLSSNLKPSATIAIPAEWLEQPGNPDLEVTLTLLQMFVWNDAPGQDYRVALNVRSVFRWPVRWEPPPEPDGSHPGPEVLR